jgi:hypothetical protein
MVKRDTASRTRHALVFAFTAFLTKLVSEFIHEVIGHGSFVLLFGGLVTEVKISLLWPYQLSHIEWAIPPLLDWQMAWIYAGGILATTLTFILVQVLLLPANPRWEVAVTLNWLSFWCLMNAGGYLVVGAVYPFGDIAELVSLNALSSQQSLILGIVLIFVGFFLISRSLTVAVRLLLGIWAPLAPVIMWSVLPLVVWLAMAGLGVFSHVVIVASFIPLVTAIAIGVVLIRRNSNSSPVTI